jgi:excinuclease ABC subunit B
VEKGDRILVSTLTKRMAEDLADFLDQAGLRVEYLHSDIDAIERVEILRRLRKGDFDILIGVNLLREGLDLPEVALVAILDADKEGFLRSRTSLIQTAGRAARHIEGRVILYADRITDSIQATLDICDERRSRQMEYNEEHGIIPKTITREIQEGLQSSYQYEQKEDKAKVVSEDEAVSKEVIAELETSMLEAAQQLNFEKAALLRDQIDLLKNKAKGTAARKSNGSAKKRKSKGMYNKDGLPKRKSRKR